MVVLVSYCRTSFFLIQRDRNHIKSSLRAAERSRMRGSAERMAVRVGQMLLLLLVVLVELGEAAPVDKPPQIVKKLEKQILLKFGPLNKFVLVSAVLTRAGHATTRPRQCVHVFRLQSCWLLHCYHIRCECSI